MRYASGAAVAVLVAGEQRGLVVEVLNDRTGGDVALAGIGTGNGLRGLRELVTACGGTLDAGPLKGGWRLAAQLPRRSPVRSS